TYVAIRSGKHDKSDASSHAFDFSTLVELQEFKDIITNSNGQIKPVVIVSVDGGPDENPRFESYFYFRVYFQFSFYFRHESVQSFAIDHFVKYDLDYLFIATHAPHHSAYNIVERRMAPLSHDLAGLILPHEHYGSHLNKSLKCIDSELEVRNFAKAGQVLAEVWSNTVIDGEPVVARYIDPSSTRPVPTMISEKKQVAKCKNLRG